MCYPKPGPRWVGKEELLEPIMGHRREAVYTANNGLAKAYKRVYDIAEQWDTEGGEELTTSAILEHLDTAYWENPII